MYTRDIFVECEKNFFSIFNMSMKEILSSIIATINGFGRTGLKYMTKTRRID